MHYLGLIFSKSRKALFLYREEVIKSAERDCS